MPAVTSKCNKTKWDFRRDWNRCRADSPVRTDCQITPQILKMQAETCKFYRYRSNTNKGGAGVSFQSFLSLCVTVPRVSNAVLFLAEKYSHGHPAEIKILPQLVFEIVLVRFLDVIREIAEKGK
jgi:hypothetical protein